jgi:hypothetical protein
MYVSVLSSNHHTVVSNPLVHLVVLTHSILFDCYRTLSPEHIKHPTGRYNLQSYILQLVVEPFDVLFTIPRASSPMTPDLLGEQLAQILRFVFKRSV